MKKLSIKLFAIALFGLFFVTSCGDDPSSERAEQKMEEAADAVGDAMKSEMNDLERNIKEAQQDIDRRLEELDAKMENATADAKVKMEEQKQELKASKDRLAEDLNKLGNTTKQEWQQFSENVKETIRDIGDDNDR